MAMNAGPVAPRRSSRASGVRPVAATRFVDLVPCFGKVGLDGQVELPRVHDDLFPRRIADRVGRVRGKRKGEQRRMLERIARRESPLQARVGVRARRASQSRAPASPASRACPRSRTRARRHRDRNTCRCSRSRRRATSPRRPAASRRRRIRARRSAPPAARCVLRARTSAAGRPRRRASASSPCAYARSRGRGSAHAPAGRASCAARMRHRPLPPGAPRRSVRGRRSARAR